MPVLLIVRNQWVNVPNSRRIVVATVKACAADQPEAIGAHSQSSNSLFMPDKRQFWSPKDSSASNLGRYGNGVRPYSDLHVLASGDQPTPVSSDPHSVDRTRRVMQDRCSANDGQHAN